MDIIKPRTQKDSESHLIALVDEKSSLLDTRYSGSRRSLHSRSQSWRRVTIFSDAAIEDITETFGTDKVQFLEQWGGFILQLAIFLLVVTLGGFHPLVYEAALRNETTGDKKPEFNPHTVYMAGFLATFILATLSAGAVHGKKEFVSCLNFKTAAIMLPIAASFAFTETLDMYILERLDSASKTTLGQIKLPFTALISVLILGAYIPSLEWLQIFGATASIVGYSIFSSRHVETRIDPIGVGYVFLNVFVSTFGCIGAEFVLKNQKQRFLVRLAQMRVGAFLVSTCFFFIYTTQFGLWHQPFFHGWTWKVVLLVFWSTIKDWLTQALIKRLDNVWRTLAGSLSLCLSYAASSIYHQNTDVVLLIFVLMLVIHVIALALAKRERFKRIELLEETTV